MTTANQKMLCKAILTNDFGRFNGATPPDGYVFDHHDFQVWSDCIQDNSLPGFNLKGKALSGTVGAAVQAGLIGSDGECVWLLAPGFALAMEA